MLERHTFFSGDMPQPTSGTLGRGLARLLRVIRLFSIGAVTLAAFALPALANGEWVVKRVSGIAYFVAPEVQAYRVKKGMVFRKGYTLGTRAGSRVLIARGPETIAVAPNTTFALSSYRSNGASTTLLQRKGTLEVDVQKRSRPHFSVETPFFAAVVKGTRFTVSVRGQRGEVSVQRGVVGVSDFASGDTVDLGAGQSASSAPSRQVGLTVGGRIKPTVRQGRKRAPAFQTPAVPNVPAPGTAATVSGSNSTSNGNSGNGNSNGNGNGNSNGNDTGNSNGNGTGNSNGNGNGNGNSNGNGNGNSNGNGNGNGNGNSNGNGNGNSNGNGNGNSNGNGNGNSSGNGTGNSNGNGNGNSSGNGTGNSNGNGNGNSNGNGNGNSNGNGNGNSSGNGNSNGNGNGNRNGNGSD
jgi:hypothetical protein